MKFTYLNRFMPIGYGSVMKQIVTLIEIPCQTVASIDNKILSGTNLYMYGYHPV